MAANKQVNLWVASTAAERNSLRSGDGLAVGDFCLVDGINLAVAVVVSTTSSTWRAMAGVPSGGHVALGGKNTADSLMRTVFDMSAVEFSPRLETTPSSITFATIANANWPTLPVVVGLPTQAGFAFSGTSNAVAANVIASWRGTYTFTY